MNKQSGIITGAIVLLAMGCWYPTVHTMLLGIGVLLMSIASSLHQIVLWAKEDRRHRKL